MPSGVLPNTTVTTQLEQARPFTAQVSQSTCIRSSSQSVLRPHHHSVPERRTFVASTCANRRTRYRQTPQSLVTPRPADAATPAADYGFGMTYPDPAQRLADLELKVDGLVQLVEHLYHQLGVSAPSYQPPGAQRPSTGTPGAGMPGVAAFSPATDPQILQAIADGNLILAIKTYRERTGVGLKEAKDAVEAMAGRR